VPTGTGIVSRCVGFWNETKGFSAEAPVSVLAAVSLHTFVFVGFGNTERGALIMVTVLIRFTVGCLGIKALPVRIE